jgi:hypothetical protein
MGGLAVRDGLDYYFLPSFWKTHISPLKIAGSGNGKEYLLPACAWPDLDSGEQKYSVL